MCVCRGGGGDGRLRARSPSLRCLNNNKNSLEVHSSDIYLGSENNILVVNGNIYTTLVKWLWLGLEVQ